MQYKHKICLPLCLALVLLLAACGGNTGNGNQNTSATPTPQPVNGFGTAANHVHSMLALPGHVLLLATHYGIFRSQDDGASWQKVAAGPNQLMQGLMAYSMTSSTLDPQRLYVLTQIATVPHSGTLGLYTSADQGRTWKLAITTASVTSGAIFFAVAGNDNPSEVFIYLTELGALGLRVSMDNGQHFSSPGGTLPFGNLLGLLPLPGAPGHLLAYGNSGVAISSDAGGHWQVVKSITSGIFDMTTAGPHMPIYASGDSGIYVSQDGGKSFTLVYSSASYSSLTASPTQPQVLYGKAGLAIYRSTTGGKTWTTLPNIKGNLAVLAVDPTNASTLYLSLSYPTALYRLQGSGGWQSLTPAP